MSVKKALSTQTYIPPQEQDPADLAWMREALIMVGPEVIARRCMS
jgi:hypothetical protein